MTAHEGLARNLKRARIAAGLTQQAVASKLDVHRTEVSRWEAGGRPKDARLREIAKLYGVTVASLLEGDDTRGVSYPTAPERLSVGERSALWALYSVQEHLQGQIRRVLAGEIPELRDGLSDAALVRRGAEAVAAHRRGQAAARKDTGGRGEPRDRPA